MFPTAARDIPALILPGGVAVLLCLLVAVREIVEARRRQRWFAREPWRSPAPPLDWPGFTAACSAAGLLLALDVCYHLGTGFAGIPSRPRTAALVLACLAAGSGAGLLLLLRHARGGALAELGMALVSLAACCAAVVVVPDQPRALSLRYPLIFNAVLVGLAAVSWFWAWLACVWQQQLDGGQAWTTAGRLIRPARRLSFVAAFVALGAGVLMTVWPRLTVAPGMDDSLGRVTAGVAGHLALLWATLWCARRLRAGGFILLAAATVISLLAFIYLRTAPLTTAAF